jgi:hypothetical protein
LARRPEARREKKMSDRTVATDALEVLGMPNLGGKQVGRDAIHLAVEPATAGESLGVARSVRREPNGLWYHCADGSRMAIVDPFLTSPVREGERFLAVVPPRQITSLRHVWAHPEFPDEGEQPVTLTTLIKASPAQSEEWLRQFIAGSDCPDYDTVVAVALGQTGLSAPGYERYGCHTVDDGNSISPKVTWAISPMQRKP